MPHLRLNSVASLFLMLVFMATSAFADTLYRLNDTATYQAGCFDPCLCPVGQQLAVRGTFSLGPGTPGNVVDFHEVSGVNWRVVADDTVLHTIRGSGVYRISNFGPDRFHSLDLDLSIDGQPVQHFFSDDQPVSANDGRIDLQVSVNGVYCFDIVIRVDASPVPDSNIRPYQLIPGSTYQIACFDPCDCVSQEPRPLRGKFNLVNLFDTGTYAEFAMVDVRLGTQSPSIVDMMLTLAGSGHYTLIQGFAGPAHAMELDLTINGDALFHFDQELENTDTQFPAIDIVVDMNEQVCTDTVLTLKARPLTDLNPAAGLRVVP